MGTFGSILSTGQQALLAHQTALQVTGQNIANANTPGYSRERAELVSAPTSSTSTLALWGDCRGDHARLRSLYHDASHRGQ